ncbi:Putative ATP-dependent helicase IRC3 [Malassezia vespertilionis]|uniref:Putative ATP-dependent helicase IRC3 n=1 Tax=Malassezia vespertilionis TaxID=2020962 RepID=UPI0024B21FD9|nr:Putative ATP-dependent helicase IRC3 [Malassezia vespertilionis]WFD06715.1 Putative ATP-dependent helicase IRC3 [Malassezia vespertilionis]
MFTELIAQIEPRGIARQALVLVNAVALAEQARATVQRMLPHLSVEIEQGAKNKASGRADVTIATLQSLRHASRLEKYDPERFKCVIVDEAHHSTSTSYLRVLSHFHNQVRTQQAPEAERDAGMPPMHPRVPIIGFSATFSRHDGYALGNVYDQIVFHKDFLAMIQEAWLSPLRFTAVHIDLDLSKVTRTGRDYNVASLAKVMNRPAMNALVVRTWIAKAHKMRRSTLVFAVNIEHINALVAEFHARGVEARGIHSGMPLKVRDEVLNAFRNGAFPVLINCAILTEGADVPPIDCILLARPTQSQNLFSQMIGRGMRLSPGTGKEDCLIVDLVGNLDNELVCTPTLFGLFDAGHIENASIDELLARKQEQTDNADVPAFESEAISAVTFVDYDDPQALVEAMQTRGSRAADKHSQNAWVDCGGQVFVLSSYDGSYVKIQREKDLYVGYHYPRNPAVDWSSGASDSSNASASPYWQKKVVLRSEDFGHAIRGCDTYMQKKMSNAGRSPLWLRRHAMWRHRPASVRARATLAKKLGDGQKAEDFTEISHGRMHTILTRLRHGGKMRWKRTVQQNNKRIRHTEARNPSVQVGPLPKAA